jgi:hypothetical protein
VEQMDTYWLPMLFYNYLLRNEKKEGNQWKYGKKSSRKSLLELEQANKTNPGWQQWRWYDADDNFPTYPDRFGH